MAPRIQAREARYELARRLRQDLGLPYKQIAARLQVSVATAYAWTSDIELSQEQNHRNFYGPGGPGDPKVIAARNAAWSDRCRRKRSEAQGKGRLLARKGDPLHAAGCMLFWAEGSKRRNEVKLCNSDPQLLAFFVRFLRLCFEVEPTDLSISLNVYTTNGLTIEAIENDWLGTLDLPQSCLRKHQLNHFPTSTSGRKKNKLPYGVCTLRVLRSTHLVQHIYGAIQEYGGFDEPAWLD